MSVPAEGTPRADAGRLPVPPAAGARRRRRPSGEPPPLPRQLNKSGKFWLAVAGVAVLFCALLVPSGGLTLRLDEVEGPVLSGLSALRLDPLTTFFRGLDAAIGPVVLVVWWGSLLVMLIWRRWRHLFVWIGTMWLVSNLTDVARSGHPATATADRRDRGLLAGLRDAVPAGGGAHGHRVNVLYALVPAGRARDRGKLDRRGAGRARLRWPALPGHGPPDRHPGRRRSSGWRSRWRAGGCWCPTTSSRSRTGAGGRRTST